MYNQINIPKLLANMKECMKKIQNLLNSQFTEHLRMRSQNKEHHNISQSLNKQVYQHQIVK